MQIPEAVRNAMKAALSREAQREVGIEVARETLEMVKDHPFNCGATSPAFGQLPRRTSFIGRLAHATQ